MTDEDGYGALAGTGSPPWEPCPYLANVRISWESMIMYSKKISRAEPGLIVMIIDDSGSMGQNLMSTTDTKATWVERYTGYILKELLARSTEESGGTVRIKPRYHIGTVLYGTSAVGWPGEDEDAANTHVPLIRAVDIEAAIRAYAAGGNSLGLSGKLGGTDAAQAFERAYDLLSTELGGGRFTNSFPPMVFHLTDGESGSDALPVANKMRQLATTDGNVLIVNAFIGVSTQLAYHDHLDFPGYTTAAEAGPNSDSIRLFEMSSPIPDTIRENLITDGIFPSIRPDARLYFDVRTREMLRYVLQTVGSIGSRGRL